MEMRSTKLSDARHAMGVTRDDGSTERVELDSRRFITHDFAHLAVDAELELEHGSGDRWRRVLRSPASGWKATRSASRNGSPGRFNRSCGSTLARPRSKLRSSPLRPTLSIARQVQTSTTAFGGCSGSAGNALQRGDDGLLAAGSCRANDAPPIRVTRPAPRRNAYSIARHTLARRGVLSGSVRHSSSRQRQNGWPAGSRSTRTFACG